MLYEVITCEDLYWEDFEIGHQVRTIRRTLTEGESMTFNTLMCDIHPYVNDKVFSEEEGLFGRRLLAGAFVFSAGIRITSYNVCYTKLLRTCLYTT